MINYLIGQDENGFSQFRLEVVLLGVHNAGSRTELN